MGSDNPCGQPPLSRYFQSPVVEHVAVPRRKRSPRIDGVAGLITRAPQPAASGLLITKPCSEKRLEEAFGSYGQIRYIRCLKQCCFVVYEDCVDTRSIVGKYHTVGEEKVFVDAIKGGRGDFVPSRLRNRANLYYNRKSKFV
jgi:hypothetical protein